MTINVHETHPISEQTHYLRSLWTQFRTGDKQAFEKLARENYRPLFNYGQRISSDADLVHDCIQELFLELWEKRDTVSEAEYVRTYLLRALRNKILKESLRLRRLKEAEQLAFEPIYDLPVESLIMETEHQLEMAQQLKQLVNNLSKRQREIIYLRFYQNLEYEDIARIMELNRQSVANLLHRTIKEIKNHWALPLISLLLLLRSVNYLI